MGLFSTIQSGLQSTISSAGSGIATGIASKYLSPGASNGLKTGISALGDITKGNLTGAAGSLLSAASKKLPSGLTNLLGTALLQGGANPLFGGITPAKAREISSAIASRNFAKKNMFLIEIKNRREFKTKITGDDGVNSFNIFVTDLSYSPHTINGEKYKIGSAEVDGVEGRHSVELRMNMLDDREGNIQDFLDWKAAQVSSGDGTVNLPDDYLMEVTIIHGYTTHDSYTNSVSIGKRYLMRLASVEVDLDRRDDALQSFQVTLTQYNTFTF